MLNSITEAMKDFYHVLGVSEDASQAEIRTAYRRRAMTVHPDCSDEDGRTFRELQEAYDVLRDPVRRKAYDRRRRQAARQRTRSRGEPLRPTATTGENPRSDLLSELRHHFGRRSTPPPHPAQELPDVKLRVRLSPREARFGGRFRVRLSLPATCGRCGGLGWAGFDPCPFCHGDGIVREQMPVMISFPPGIRDGQQADLSLAALGLRRLNLSLTFTIVSEGSETW